MLAYGFLILLTVLAYVFFRNQARSRKGYNRNIALSNEEIQARYATVEVKTITVFFTSYIILLGLRDPTV